MQIKNAKGEWVEKVYDYVIACSSLKGKISDMKVMEDFESRPHSAVTIVVERGKARQEWNEQKLPKEAKRQVWCWAARAGLLRGFLRMVTE